MPLTDLRVVDLTRILAGPFATMMLGDMGAEVFKIERPETGDDARGWGPPFVDGVSTYFLAVNRNKRSVTLDLKSATGQQLLWELVESADVLVSNFRVGVMERLGFGYEAVARRAPKCVYAVVNGYGSSGPRATKPAFDVAIQAESGLMDLTGFSDGRPTKVGISIADEIAGMYVVQGILLALLERQRTHRGQMVEVALHDAMLSMFTFQAQRYLSAGQQPERIGNRHPSIAPYETFDAADGMVVVAVGNEALWRRFCEAIDRAHLVEHPNFLTNADRVANRDLLESELNPAIKEHPVSYWEECLSNAGVPCGRVRAFKEVIDSERQADGGMIVNIDGDGLLGLGIPVKLSASPGKIRSRPPKLGEHTEAVFSALGHSKEEFAAWRAEGVV